MRKIKKLGYLAMAFLMLTGSILTQNPSVPVVDAADTTSEPVMTTMAEPENLALNTKITDSLVHDRAHYYSITTDNKNVDYEFLLINDAPSDDPNFSILYINIVVQPFRKDGIYDYKKRVIKGEYVDPTRARTYKNRVTLKKNTKYLITLTPFYLTETPYHFSVYQVSRTPALKKVTPKKGKVVVQFSKTQIAKSYEIAVKKQGGSWKTYKTKKNTYTIKNFKSKKQYSIRVRSMCTVNGTKKYSAWSKTKKVKVK